MNALWKDIGFRFSLSCRFMRSPFTRTFSPSRVSHCLVGTEGVRDRTEGVVSFRLRPAEIWERTSGRSKTKYATQQHTHMNRRKVGSYETLRSNPRLEQTACPWGNSITKARELSPHRLFITLLSKSIELLKVGLRQTTLNK